MDMDETDEVLRAWKDKPIGARRFATDTAIDGYSKREVEKIIRRSEIYGLLAEAPKKKRGTLGQFVQSEMKRGALTFADTAYISGFFGGTAFVLVQIDYYSKLHAYQPMASVSGRATVKALEAIMARLPYKIEKIVTDKGFFAKV